MKKYMTRRTLVLLVIVGVLVFAGFSNLLRTLSLYFVQTDAIYAGYSPTQMMSESDVIFAGTVKDISASSWNQDSKNPWSDGLVYHTIEMELITSVVGEFSTDNPIVTLTVIGSSPVEREDTDHNLQVGDEVMVFARDTEFAWREGGRIPATMFLGMPSQSAWLKNKDGYYEAPDGKLYTLSDLTATIINERATN